MLEIAAKATIAPRLKRRFVVMLCPARSVGAPLPLVWPVPVWASGNQQGANKLLPQSTNSRPLGSCNQAGHALEFPETKTSAWINVIEVSPLASRA